jgi:hypothetical protein
VRLLVEALPETTKLPKVVDVESVPLVEEPMMIWSKTEVDEAMRL